jgi:membrane protein YdbS with pleckstrin-like domain
LAITEQEGLRALDPRQVKLLRLRAALLGLALVAASSVVDLIIRRETELPVGLVSGAAVLLALVLLLWMPRRRYRAWAYRMDEDELRIHSGLLVRSATIVPFGRVQHTDIVRGPLQRLCGLASLVLHTAGTRSAATVLPGLDSEEAERMRDHVRARIREDLA